MRRLVLSLAVAAVVGTGLAATTSSPAQAQYYDRAQYGGWGYYNHDGDGWRERAWHEQRWREWMWRRHYWHEWHERHGWY